MPGRRASAIFFSNYFLLYASFAVLTPYLQLYFKSRGFSASRIGLLLGIVELAGLAGPLLVARLADARGSYRGLLVASLLASAAAFAAVQFSSGLLAAAGLAAAIGFSYRSTTPLLDSSVSRSLPDPARQYGRFRVAGSVGFIVVSLVLQFSGVVSADSSWSILVAFCASALLAAAAAGFLPAVPRTAPGLSAQAAPGSAPRSAGGSAGGSAAAPSTDRAFDRGFWAVIGIIFLGRFGMGAYYSFFSLYLRDTFGGGAAAAAAAGAAATAGAAGHGGGPVALGGAVSLMWALGSVAEIGPMWFSGRLIARWGLRPVLLVSLLAISVRLSLFVVAPSLLVVGAAQLLHAFTFGTFHPAAVAYINAKVPAQRRGLGMALYNAVGIGLASFTASAVGGYIVEARGYVTLFLLYALVPLGAAVLLFTKAGRAGILDPWKPRPF